jgi:hypothetical protein
LEVCGTTPIKSASVRLYSEIATKIELPRSASLPYEPLAHFVCSILIVSVNMAREEHCGIKQELRFFKRSSCWGPECFLEVERIYLTKFAWTVVSPLTVTVHTGDVPEQEPVQPVKRKPVSGAAVKLRVAPWATLAEQVLPQSIPAEPTIDPLPEVLATSLNV